MQRPEGQPENSFAGRDWFATTHWSVVLAAGRCASPNAQAALEQLCRTYWYPLYAYVRRRGNAAHDAQDLTQEFFSRLLAGDSLAQVSADKGKFRSFLLAAINHFLSNEHERSQAQKRGGGREIISLDEHAPEERYRFEPVSDVTPDVLFERRWAWTLLEQAMRRLREEFDSAGKGRQFDRVKAFLENEAQPGDYERLAGEMQTTPGALAIAVHRLRHRYRELVRLEIANTVASPGEVEEEMRHLLTLLTQ